LLSKYPWDWHATLTFKNPISSLAAFKKFNKWKVELKKSAHSQINYVLITENSPSRDAIPHLHLLLFGAINQKPYIWQQRWYQIGGLAEIELYNPILGANYYVIIP
jgi:hypothetical protein